jgi:hypothetical protein
MAASQPSMADSQSCTEVGTFDHTTSWTIKRFLLLLESSKVGDFLFSSEIEIKVVGPDGQPATTVWYLECDPAGSEEKYSGHISLFLNLKSLGRLTTKSIRAEVKLRLEAANQRSTSSPSTAFRCWDPR